MSFKDCYAEIAKSLGRELSDAEKKEISSDLKSITDNLSRQDSIDDLGAAIAKETKKLTDSKVLEAAIEKRNAVLNTSARLKTKDYLKSVWADDPGEGIVAVLGNSLVDRFGSKNGVASSIQTKKAKYVMGFQSELISKGLDKFAEVPALQKDIFLAVHELTQDAPNADILAKLDPNAVEVGKIMSKYQELSRLEANKAGAWINKRAGYVIRRSHDQYRIAKAAGMEVPVNDIKHFHAWRDFVADKLDWENMGFDVPMNRREQFLKEMFNQFASGVHVKFGDAGSSINAGAANIGAKMSRGRQLEFKNAEAEFAYHEKFGNPDGIVGNFVNGLNRVARDTAIMERLGPNAEANLKQVVSEIEAEIARGDSPASLSKFRDKAKKEISTSFSRISGAADIPENVDFARGSGSFRKVQQLRDLNSAILSSLTDVPFAASVYRYGGERTAGDFFKGMGETVSGLVDNWVRPKESRAQIAAEFGILVDSVSNPAAIFGADNDTPGMLSNWVQSMFRWTGLTRHQDGIRTGSVLANSLRYAQHADKVLGELPDGMQAVLRQFNIGEKEWDLIRASSLTEIEGQKYLSPSSLDSISDDAIKGYLGNQKATKNRITKAREEIKDNYRNLFSEMASMAATEPGAMERAIQLGGSRPGSAAGELLRHFWMYKSFTVSSMRKHIGRELFGYGTDRISSAQALKNLILKPGQNAQGLGGLANMVVWGTLAGYGSITLKDIAKGRKPREINTKEDFVKTFAAAAAQSGSFGIYGDFLFAQTNRFGGGVVSTLAGPTARSVDDLYSIYRGVVTGEDAKSKAFDFVRNMTPGLNTISNSFYTKTAMDYAITYRMHEIMNPGYLHRMERRLKSEKNQEFFVPPSQVIPYGGK